MPQDFSGQNLRGRSFKGQNLEGANFSGADIRSAGFTGANLRGANFSYAQAGLQNSSKFILVISSLFLSTLSGFISVVGGAFVTYFFLPRVIQNMTFLPGVFVIAVLVALFYSIIYEGLLAGTGIVAISIALGVVGAGVTAGNINMAASVAGATGVAGAMAMAVVLVCSWSLTGTVATSGFFGVGVSMFGIAFGIALGAIACVIGLNATKDAEAAGILQLAIAIAVVMAFALTSSYITWRALGEDNKYVLIRKFALAFAAIGGTSFRNADLTDANFTAATLKSSDFRKANLIRTCFHKTKKLDRVRPGSTYLQNSQVRQLLVTLQGQNKNFDREDLRRVNLQGAYLKDASFIGADLSQANLQDADLSRAKLVQTQLDGTDFTGANLTGAYIEDWNITTDTKFDGVQCEYVYMRLPTKESPDPHRKPDNRQEVFADGEFGDFIKPIFDTLDLYHNQGVDPRAIAISFKQLAENHPEADLRIVGMEVRGDDKFLLRAKTAIAADKSELSAEYFALYNQLKALAEQKVKALIAEKDSRIADLQNMVVTALQRPSFYSNVEQVGFMSNNPGGISQNVSGGQVYGGMQAAQGKNNVQTSTTYSSPEQKQTLAEAAAEIQQLLEQLSQSYPTNTMAGKMALAAEATQRIENNPTLMHKTISALRAGGTAALEQVLSHPAASFVIAALDDWNQNNP